MSIQLSIDTGVQEYEINGNGVLRFNPSDPNVYERFFAALDQITVLETKYDAEIKAVKPQAIDEHGYPMSGKTAISIFRDLDIEVKNILRNVFGEDNDWDVLLDGVNLMAVGANGERVITNVLIALKPIIEAGLKQHLDAKAAEAKAAVTAERGLRDTASAAATSTV